MNKRFARITWSFLFVAIVFAVTLFYWRDSQETAPASDIQGQGGLSKAVDEALEMKNRVQQYSALFNLVGRVIDQEGRPLPDATVVVNASTALGLAIITAKTDQNGEFALRNGRGAAANVFVRKEGFIESERNQHIFDFVDRTSEYYRAPLSERRVEFVLISSAAAQAKSQQPISQWSKKSAFGATAEVLQFAISSGTAAAGNEVEIRVTPGQKVKDDKRDYLMEIVCQSGDVVRSAKRYLETPPEGGYVSKLEVSAVGLPGSAGSNGTETFFVRSADQRVHGKLVIEWQNGITNNYIQVHCRIVPPGAH